MKKSISFLLPALLFFAEDTRAQFFVEAHATHLLPVGGIDMTSITDAGVDAELLNFGRGTGGGLAFGGNLNGTLGWEARFTYIGGPEQTISDHTTSDYSERTSTDSWTMNYVRIEPALRISTGQGALRGYVAVGPAIVVAPKVEYTGTSSYAYINSYDPEYSYVRIGNYSQEFKGGIGLGGSGALGITWAGSGAFGLFAEVQASAMNWAPKESSYSYEEIRTYGSGQVEIDSESGTSEYHDHVDPEEEDKEPTLHLPMSTWGFRAGIRLTLGSPKG